MPRNFTPADRATVRELMDNAEHVNGTSKIGVGVLAEVDTHGTDMFTEVMEGYGWYCAGISRRPDWDYQYFMPVTEVPE